MSSAVSEYKQKTVVQPGQWLGVVGGGQLGRMFCHAAQRLGYHVAVLDPDINSPTGQVADRHFCAAYDDVDALGQMADLCAAITTEFENVPATTLQQLARRTTVAPAAAAVEITQDRAREKRFLQGAGIAVVPFHEVLTAADIEQAADGLFPGILKTARLGYDGKGQVRVGNRSQARQAFEELGAVPCVLEAQLDLQAEISVVLGRDQAGQSICFDPSLNVHRDGILALSMVAGEAQLAEHVAPQLLAQARKSAEAIAQAADYVGVLCVEFFVLGDGQLLANEIAPRPHNSGHHTIEACLCSQFEQQVRALAGQPLGATTLVQPAVMVNILGDCWFRQGETAVTPDWSGVLAVPGVALHLYGKAEARRGRKMGHLTAVGTTLAEAQQRATKAARLLGIED